MIEPAELMQLAITKARAGMASGQTPFGCAIAKRGSNCRGGTQCRVGHDGRDGARGSHGDSFCMSRPGAGPAGRMHRGHDVRALPHVHVGSALGPRRGGLLRSDRLRTRQAAGFNELSLPAADLLRLGGSPRAAGLGCAADRSVSPYLTNGGAWRIARIDDRTDPILQIVSGGQTGVDRAALDVAIELGTETRRLVPAGSAARKTASFQADLPVAGDRLAAVLGPDGTERDRFRRHADPVSRDTSRRHQVHLGHDTKTRQAVPVRRPGRTRDAPGPRNGAGGCEASESGPIERGGTSRKFRPGHLC